MSKRWLFLFGTIFVLHFATSRAFPAHASPVAGEKRSLRAPRSAVGRQDTIHTEESAALFQVPGTQENDKSFMMVPRVRRRRSEITDVSNGTSSILDIPSNLIRRILAVPGNIIRSIKNWASGIIGRISEKMMIEAWKFAINSGIPTLDEMCLKIVSMESVPESIKTMMNSAHSAYVFMKMMGYMKPA